ncbi:MAG: ABC transporter permease [Parvibaculaceae bacterium]
MIRFVLADLKRLWAAALVIICLVGLASALGIGVALQERALRLGSARAADKFDLVIGAAGSETQLVLSSVFLQTAPLPLLPGEVLTKLRQDPRVAWAAPIGFGDSYETYPVVGSTPELVSALTNGAEIAGNAPGTLYDAVIGASVALVSGQTFAPVHGLAGNAGHVHTDFTYKVVGRMAPTDTAWDRAIIVPIEAVWAVHNLHAQDNATPVVPGLLDGSVTGKLPGVPAILVKPKTIADAYKLRGEYRGDATMAVFPGEVLTRLYATLGDARTVMSFIALASQGLVAAAIALIAIAHVNQRRRQIGALRAFGAPRSAIFGIVWSEAIFLMASGIALGFLIGWAAVRLLSTAFTAQNGVVLPVEFQSSDLGLAAGLVLGAAVIASIPAVLALRAPPAAALRA